MGLVSSCEHHFSKNMRKRGEEYQRNGRVRSLKVTGTTAQAFVAGSEEYYATIDWSDAQEIGVACDCPYYWDHFVCKHLWAVILELDRKGVGQEVGARARFQNRLADLEDEDDELDDDIEDHWPAPRGSSQAVSKVQKAKKQSWQADLRELQPADANSKVRGLWDAQAKQRQVLYAIDVGLSHAQRKLVLRLLQQERKRDGELGKPTKLTLSRDAVELYKATPDAPLLEWLTITAQSAYSYGYGSYSAYSGLSEFYLPTVALYEMLPRLADTGRLFWGLEPAPPIQPGDLHVVTWDDGAPWRLQLKVSADDEQQQWLLAGRLVRDDDPSGRPLSESVFASQTGIVLWPDRIARLDAQGQDGWLRLLRQRETIAVPYGDREAFLKTLFELPELPHVEWPANLSLARDILEPRGHLTVFSPPNNYRAKPELHARVAFDYAGTRVRWRDPRREIFDVANQRVLKRDTVKEQHLLEMVTGFGIRQVTEYYERERSDIAFPPASLPAIVQHLPIEHWQVEAEGNLLRRAGNFSMSVSSGVEWFELAGEFDFDGVSATLPEILAAMRKGEQYVQLGDGTRGLLPQAWLAKYGAVINLAEEKEGKLQFKPTQAMILDALLAAHDNAKADRKFNDYRRKVAGFAGVKPAAAPRTFAGELRPYQQEGLGWLRFLQEFGFGGCLADDMGLGKTVQVLALLEGRRTRRLAKDEAKLPSLVVVPRSLIFNWQAEAQRFAPKLRVLNFSEKDRKGQWERVGEHDVVLTTYGTLLRDITKLHAQEFDYAILDEAQAIKNANSQSAKACRLLRARHRLTLTGTPIENHLGELWSLVEFLNPGMLGKFTAFSSLANGSGTAPSEAPTHALIAKAVRPILLRRTKQQVLKDLPDKTEQTIFCDLSAPERKKYNELRDYYRASLTSKIDEIGLERSKIHVLEALLRLRQASCHLGLLDDKLRSGSSAKLDVLLEQIEELAAEKHKALVFSQFTQLLGIVRGHLDKKGVRYEYLDGQTRDRQKRVECFQSDASCPLFLVSLKAGGRGLNLTAADYVFILDPWWNPAVEAQAIDRAHRIGQTQPVFAYRLIARDTVEEKIIELQRSKRELADSIISADSSVLRNLTVDDLKMLLD